MAMPRDHALKVNTMLWTHDEIKIGKNEIKITVFFVNNIQILWSILMEHHKYNCRIAMINNIYM